MSSTKSCWFVPKREFLLRISHCLIKILIPNIHYNINLSARHRKLKWNIVCSLVVNCFFSFDIYHCHWVKGHFRNLKGNWGRNASRNCFWDCYWGLSGPRSLCKVNSTQFPLRFLGGEWPNWVLSTKFAGARPDTWERHFWRVMKHQNTLPGHSLSGSHALAVIQMLAKSR